MKPLKFAETVAHGIRVNPGFQKQVSDDQVAEYFRENPLSKRF